MLPDVLWAKVRGPEARRVGYLNGVELDFFRPGTPTDNPFIEAFKARVRAECLNAR